MTNLFEFVPFVDVSGKVDTLNPTSDGRRNRLSVELNSLIHRISWYARSLVAPRHEPLLTSLYSIRR